MTKITNVWLKLDERADIDNQLLNLPNVHVYNRYIDKFISKETFWQTDPTISKTLNILLNSFKVAYLINPSEADIIYLNVLDIPWHITEDVALIEDLNTAFKEKHGQGV